jgi:hypothetical protein
MARRKTRAPIATIAALTPMVVALRLPTLFSESMRHAGARPETSRAVTEKLAAVTESVLEMQAELVAASVRAWWQIATGTFDHSRASRAHADVVDAALRPVARRVRANYRRLGG